MTDNTDPVENPAPIVDNRPPDRGAPVAVIYAPLTDEEIAAIMWPLIERYPEATYDRDPNGTATTIRLPLGATL